MTSTAASPEEYLAELPPEREAVLRKLRAAILAQLDSGYEECMNYGMIGYVVPHSIYPAGYHCNPKLPVPYMNIASQKNYIAVYHSGVYSDEKVLAWFTSEYPKHCSAKLDMGKSCIRFKKLDDIPYQLIGQLAGKISVQEFLAMYSKALKK